MARQKGIVKVKGKLDDLSFYEMEGKMLIKKANGPSKSKIENDPNFQRTRENMSEFGGSAHVGKALREGIAEVIGNFGGRQVVSRITKLMTGIVNNGPGVRGQRAFEIVNNAFVLNGYGITFDTVLGSVFSAPHSVAANVGRNETVLTVPDFNTSDFVRAPQGATHFRLVNTASILSDYTYNTVEKKYEPVNPAIDTLNAVAYSHYIPISGMVGAATVVTSTIAGAPVMVATAGLIGCIGIEFYQFQNTVYYLLASKNSLRIEQVF